MDGPFLDDQDFQTRVGVERFEARSLLNIENPLDNITARSLVSSCLNEVVNGINFSAREWNKWFTIPREEVKSVYSLWCSFVDVHGGLT